MKKLLLIALLAFGTSQAATYKPAPWISPDVKIDKTTQVQGSDFSLVAQNLQFTVSNPGPPNSKRIVSLCRAAILKQLKSPASARFVTEDLPPTYQLLGGIYVYDQAVDAQNSHGALLRKNHLCLLGYSGDKKQGTVLISTFELDH